MKVKRILILLVITIFAASFLLIGFSCKEEAAPAEEEAAPAEEEAAPAEEEAAPAEEEVDKVKIVSYFWDEQGFTEVTTQLANEFMEKYPQVELDVQFFADPDIPAKVKTAIAAGGGVDCFARSNFESAWFMANDTVEEVGPEAFEAFGVDNMDEYKNLWAEGALEGTGTSYEGKYYGVPISLANYVAWMNVAHMKEAGLDPEKDIPKTWDNFVEVCKKLVKVEDGIIVRNGFATNLKAGMFSYLILTES